MQNYKPTPSNLELHKIYSTRYNAIKNGNYNSFQERDLDYADLMVLVYIGTISQETAIWHLLHNMKQQIIRMTDASDL